MENAQRHGELQGADQPVVSANVSEANHCVRPVQRLHRQDHQGGDHQPNLPEQQGLHLQSEHLRQLRRRGDPGTERAGLVSM